MKKHSTSICRQRAVVPLLAFVLAFFGGCSSNDQGIVIMTDEAYSATVIGTNRDGFDVPDGLLWKEGRLYMADEGGSAFRIWTNARESKTLSDSVDGIVSPEDFVLDQKGNIYFTDDDAGGVWKINAESETSLLAGKAQGLISTEGIALSPDGEILVGDGIRHKIFGVSQNGAVRVFLDSAAGISKPESMVFDQKGNLYIADNHDRILYLFTPNKKLIRLIENRQGFSPESITYANGVLYITDSDNGKLFRYDPEAGLETIAVFGGVLAKVSGITTDDKGSIFISVQTHIDQKRSYLLRLDREIRPA